jgi:hypothetical protein
LKIAVAFFGINRSLKHTIRSIEANILAPLKAIGEVRVYGHFFELLEIDNPRSGEATRLESAQHELISFDSVILDKPDGCLSRFNLEKIYSAKDPYLDSYKSIKNLLHQLHSLDSVTELIRGSYEPDAVAFVRPDLYYHDSFRGPMLRALRADANSAFLPPWQTYGGYNDRFAICGAECYLAYGGRAKALNGYVGAGRPLCAELFLYYALRKARVEIFALDVPASRVRADGRMEDELFASTGRLADTLLRLKLALKHRL